VVELNGTPLNGTRLHRSVSTLDWTRDADLIWLPAVDESRVERDRLRAEIAAAKARADAARQRSAAREAELRAVLQAELAESRERLAALEREHDATVASIREEARAEVERILAQARDQVALRSTDVPPGEVADVD